MDTEELIERLRRGRVVRESEVITVVLDGNPTEVRTGEITEKVPLAEEAADALEASTRREEQAFKDGFCHGFDHRGRTDDPVECVKGAEREWKARTTLSQEGL